MVIWLSILITLEIIVLVVIFLIFQFSRAVKIETKRVLQKKPDPKKGGSKSVDPQTLPLPVQRYLNYALKPGWEPIQEVKVIQSGAIRTAPGKKWLPLSAVQYFHGQRPAFLWIAHIRMIPLVWMTARDLYVDQKADMTVKLFSAIPVIRSKNRQVDVSALTRYLAEMVWFPTSMLLSPYVNWKAMDDKRVQAVMVDGQNQANVIFHVDTQGRMRKVVCPNRYRAESGCGHQQVWKGYYGGYQQFGCLQLPTHIQAGWETEQGTFTYIKIQVQDVEFG